MATRIRTSSKGQVVLPKSTRDRLGITPGTELDVIDTAMGVELRPVKAPSGASVGEALQRLRQVIRYDGPPMYEADWQRGVDQSVNRKWHQPG